FTELIPFEANILLMNFQGARRQAVIWVDGAVNYEHQLLLANTGVVPFPGSDKYGGISPLWVYGSFISQQSEHPLAMWEWLKFLSYQRPVPRLIPARPSVAVDAGYWATLPPELDEAMRLAFPLARAITPEEQSYISWTQVKSVVTGEMTPIQAARQRPAVRWFGYSE
ncbi:MAG: hypothetical protein GY792_35265, partial [Gammaproteobacteria bacterium]|nr:hypothetical protein [Gammaproteobacteria bacterium]